ncbi:FAD-binding oxidoreductase [Streptomyces sp. NPDC057950]|uniref:FAD-binding oxidoreductase n=1 Tax=Streptomyces sp. NPDC057950 TaxID=3346288 RepID=UPI0036E40ECB
MSFSESDPRVRVADEPHPAGVPQTQAPAPARAAVCASCATGSAGTGRDVVPLQQGPDVETGRFKARTVATAPRPTTVAQVVAAVRAAGTGDVALHPVSTGLNWGLGSRTPVRDGAIVLDLSGLDRIRETDVRRGYAIVEPGVTQGRLAAHLTGTSRIVNLTGSSQHTSVIGGVLERGVGLQQGRAEDLAGLELVLADGTTARTGWWPGTAGAVVRPHGRGPSLNHLFTQSSWAVVTAAVVRLLPRPAAVRVLPLLLDERKPERGVDTLRKWTEQGLIPPNAKIYDPVAARTYGTPGRYLAHVCLAGDQDLVRAATEIITDRLRNRERGLALGPDAAADRWVQHAYAGGADPHDTLFLRKTGHCARCLDRARGLLLFLPIVPFEGTAVRRAAALTRECLAGATTPPGITMNVLDPDALDHVVTLGFPPENPTAVRDAHRTLDRLHEAFTREGFTVYRTDIDHPTTPTGTKPEALLRGRLERALDPHGVIAPGRH